MRFNALSLFPLFFLATPVFALDSTCEMVLKAAEARIQQPAWHSITQIGDKMRIEVIKSDGQFYRRMGEKWAKSGVNIDDTERKFLAQIRNGEWKITECKVVGKDTVNGTPVTVVSSRTEVKGAPPGETKLYIGKSDGLPYKQTGDKITVEYRYKDIVAPKL